MARLGLLLPDIMPPSLENNPTHAIVRNVQKSEAKKLRDKAINIFHPSERGRRRQSRA